MKIVAISDTHNQHEDVTLPEGDILIHCGDFSSRGRETEVVDFLAWFSVQPHKYKVVIAGNHELGLENNELEFRDQCEALGIVYLHNEEVTIEGYKFWGSPYTPWFGGWGYNIQRGEHLAAIWSQIPEDTDVLLTHGPMFGILDLVECWGSPNNGEHVGCRDLRDRIKDVKPLVHCFGHIHSEYGQIESEGVRHYNVSICTEAYRATNEPTVIELEDK